MPDLFMARKEDYDANKFDKVIGDYVMTRVRCSGDVQKLSNNFIRFLSEKMVDLEGPFRNASDKAMFYFVLSCSRGIEDELLAKYLENPLNAMILVEYKQD